MGVSAEDAVRHLRRRLAHRNEEDLAAEADAKRLLPLFVSALRAAGAVRVVLFGSLNAGYFHAASDIDLAVSGLAEPVLARLEDEFTLQARRPVELANLEALPTELRQQIESSGRELA